MVKNYKPNQVLTWNSVTEKAFVDAQAAVNTIPTLFFMNDNAPIFLLTDAPDYAFGAYLYQLVDNQEQPVAFISKGLTTSQLKWSTFEKEAYAIFYAFKKLEHMIRDIHFTLKTDHKNLLYLNEEASAKVQRWKLATQEYDFTAEHIEGTSNIVADAFSRIGNFGEAAVTQEVLCLLDDFRISDKHYRLISKVHNSMVGHHGIDKTMNKLKLQGHEWLYMREHVRRFIKLCPCCQK